MNQEQESKEMISELIQQCEAKGWKVELSDLGYTATRQQQQQRITKVCKHPKHLFNSLRKHVRDSELET